MDADPISAQPIPSELQTDSDQSNVGRVDVQANQESVVVKLNAIRAKLSVDQDP